MLQIGKTASIVAAFILSTALLTTSTSGLQFANAQTIEGCFIRKPVPIDYLLARIRSELLGNT